jgi:ABC-2 type transport system permease protein
MNKYITLTKVFLKNTSTKLSSNGKGKLPKTIILYAILILSFLPLVSMFAGVTASSYSYLKSIHQEGVILSAAMSASSTIIFVFGMFFVMSVFYFSSDIENLLILPVKPSIILMAKFTVVLIYEYFAEVIILVPVVTTFGVKSNAGLLYYIYGIIIFLTLPIMPLIIDALISIFVMRFAGFTKNKDRFKIIAQMSSLIFIVGINIIIQRIGNGASKGLEMAKLLTQGNNSLVSTSSKLFINIRYASEALISSGINGITNMLIYLIITLLLLILFIIFSDIFYLKGVVGITQTQAKRKILSSEKITKQSDKKSKIFSYTIKELNILFRTPVYFMNCVVMNFLWPVFFIIPIVSQPGLLKKAKNAHIYLNMILENSRTLGILVAIVFGVSLFFSMANPIASTSISREGKNIFINKFIPMEYKKQILSKAISAFILNFSGVMLMILIVSIVGKPPLYLVAMAVLLVVIGVIFSVFVGLFIDLNYPKLDWDNEQRAVKQNLNVIIGILIGLVTAGIVIFLTIKFKIILSVIFPAILVIFLVLDIILYRIIITKGVELYKNIE